MSSMTASLLCFFVTDWEEGGLSCALGIHMLMTEAIVSIHLRVKLHFPVDPPRLYSCGAPCLCTLCSRTEAAAVTFETEMILILFLFY